MVLKIANLVNDIYDHKISKREANKQLLLLFYAINRTFKCNRCGTIYTLVEGNSVGCCTIPTEHRTSRICGGELIEIKT